MPSMQQNEHQKSNANKQKDLLIGVTQCLMFYYSTSLDLRSLTNANARVDDDVVETLLLIQRWQLIIH
jgi:hypothetical protein